MEEDIKDLEKYISFASKEENFSYNEDWKWHKDLATKIQNLIARYKELEEEVSFLKRHCYIPFEHEKTEALGELVTIEEKKFVLEENYIPKSKVKTKIEELKNEMLNEEDLYQFNTKRYCYETLKKLIED